MEDTLQTFIQSTMQFQQAIHHSDPHPQYPQPPTQPPKSSWEDAFQMLIQNTAQFQQDTQRNLQATQSTLQANTQAIEKLELQMGQLTTLIYEDNEEEISNQPIADPIGQLEIEACSHNEQVDPITTLGNNQIIDIHICEPLEIDIMHNDSSI